MESICRRHGVDDSHWRNCLADVCTVAADLIPFTGPDQLTLGDLRARVIDFHDCHVAALVYQLACELADHGHTPDTIRHQLLVWDVTDAMS